MTPTTTLSSKKKPHITCVAYEVRTKAPTSREKINPFKPAREIHVHSATISLSSNLYPVHHERGQVAGAAAVDVREQCDGNYSSGFSRPRDVNSGNEERDASPARVSQFGRDAASSQLHTTAVLDAVSTAAMAPRRRCHFCSVPTPEVFKTCKGQSSLSPHMCAAIFPRRYLLQYFIQRCLLLL